MPDTAGLRGSDPKLPDETFLQGNVDKKFAELAVSQGLITSDQMEVVAQAHKTIVGLGLKRTLSEIMVEKGLLTAMQAETVRRTAEAGGNIKIVGGFELLEKLGEGGMGVVYKAKQISLDRIIALKILPERLNKDREFVARFVREARVAAKLDHVNVVRALDVGEAQGLHYFAMELVAGENLGSKIDRDGKMSEDTAIDILLQVARALEHAWHHQLIHRDIKPDNILVTETGVAKLADLGLARSTDENSTRMTVAGTAMGTPHYISPEQARGEPDIDIRTDIYSLGVTFFHMLTGHPPFQGSTAAVVITRRLTEDPPWVRDVRPDVSEGTSLVVRKMMARDREQRYDNPKDLIHDLELIADNKLPEIARGAPGSAPGTGAAAVEKRARSTGAIPVVSTPAPQQRAGINLGVLIGSISGAVAVVIAIVLALMAGGSRSDGTKQGAAQAGVEAQAQVFQIMSDIKQHEDAGEFDAAITMAENAKASFDGTAGEKFATRLVELRRAKERETAARKQHEAIRKLSESSKNAEALDVARKAKGTYDDTAAADDLRTQLESLEKLAKDVAEAAAKLETTLFLVNGLETEGALESALDRAQKGYNDLKGIAGVDGVDKLATAVDRIRGKLDAKVNAPLEKELAEIRALADRGGLEDALGRAVSAVDTFAASKRAQEIVDLREELRRKVREQGELSAPERQAAALLKEGAEATAADRHDAAVRAYEQALKLKASEKTQKLLADARYALHLSNAKAKEKAGDLQAAIDEIAKAIEISPSADATARRDALGARMAYRNSLASAEGLEKAGKLAEAKVAYAEALAAAAEGDGAAVQASIDRVAAKMREREADEELAALRRLIATSAFEKALGKANAAMTTFAASSKRDEFRLLRDEAERRIAETKATETTTATVTVAAAKLLERAAEEMASRQYDRAVETYRAAMELRPSNETKRLLDEAVNSAQYVSAIEAAKRLAGQGKAAEAIAAYTRALDLAPEGDKPGIRQAVTALQTPPKPPEPVQGPVEPAKTVTSPLGLQLVLIPGGIYSTGHPLGQDDEKPIRRVKLNPFYIGVHEITNDQYRRSNGRHQSGEFSPEGNGPAVNVTWQQAVDFCTWLSRRERATYRLPTEAEWEVAACGSKNAVFPWGDAPTEGGTYFANCGGMSAAEAARDGFKYAAPVGSFARGASPFGCMDMAGNVWEWCSDWYDDGYYAQSPGDDPRGPRSGSEKVVRGGSYYHPIAMARCANRHKLDPGNSQPSVGFRVVMVLPEK